FLLMRSYRSGFLPLVHVDAYRLGSLGEFDDLAALDESTGGVLLVEWGDIVASSLPGDRLTVTFERVDETTRSVTLEGAGSWTGRAIRELVG
ncbi:MAG: tRNA (adenosine(37)-N6)-threonylcarbamoyltransferase complex ATPase subunit type 1 TsaE, partial [Acidimicrobiia bacterium]|nr:tRNA (adenosine(37)-N6)-threonylcarbamoyltransferase complex ATPase subunit type 1 TsaE [Acidimicrobiia bacterium]